MKATKALVLFLTLCLAIGSVLCLGVAAEDAAATASKGLSVGAIVSLCIAGALIIAAVVLCIIKREKVKESLRSYKSELKKITWCPFKSVKNSTAIVVAFTVVLAAIIAVLDLGFSSGVIALGRLF